MLYTLPFSCRKYKADPRETKRGKQKLLASAETVKHVLSTLDTANCYIESLYEGIAESVASLGA